MARDEELQAVEREKVAERKRLGTQWMLAAEDLYQKKIEAAKNGAARGQKMSLQEIKYNKDVLKTVSEQKKAGMLNNVFEKCVSKKITELE